MCVCTHACVHVGLGNSHQVSYVDKVLSLSFCLSNQLTNIQLVEGGQVILRSSITKLTLYQEIL